MLADAVTCDTATPLFNQKLDCMTSNLRVRRTPMVDLSSKILVSRLLFRCLSNPSRPPI